MITPRRLHAVMDLAAVLIERSQAVLDRYAFTEDEQDMGARGSLQTSALRRTSLELTRELAVLRRASNDEPMAVPVVAEEPAEEPEEGLAEVAAPMERGPRGRPTEIRCSVCNQMEPVARTGRVPTMCKQCRKATPADRELLRKAASEPIGRTPPAITAERE